MRPLSTSRKLCVLRRATPPCALSPNQFLLYADRHPQNHHTAALASCRVRDWFLPTPTNHSHLVAPVPCAAFNLHRPASAANPSGFLLTALSNARRLAFLASTLLREGARPIKHLRDSGRTMVAYLVLATRVAAPEGQVKCR